MEITSNKSFPRTLVYSCSYDSDLRYQLDTSNWSVAYSVADLAFTDRDQEYRN